MLENLIPSQTRRKLLALFLLHPEGQYYLRQLARESGENCYSVSRELENLVRGGIINGTEKGRLKLYQANARSPLYPALKELVLRTEGLAEPLQQGLRKLKNVKFAFIYGSMARGEEGPHSDVDLMVIGKANPAEMASGIRQAEGVIGREVNYSIYPEEEFLGRLDRGFIQEVLRDKKIMLIGDEDGLQRLLLRRRCKACEKRSSHDKAVVPCS